MATPHVVRRPVIADGTPVAMADTNETSRIDNRALQALVEGSGSQRPITDDSADEPQIELVASVVPMELGQRAAHTVRRSTTPLAALVKRVVEVVPPSPPPPVAPAPLPVAPELSERSLTDLALDSASIADGVPVTIEESIVEPVEEASVAVEPVEEASVAVDPPRRSYWFPIAVVLALFASAGAGTAAWFWL